METKNPKVKSTGETVKGQIVLQITEGEFEGTAYIYQGMKFADEENEDGSINMSFEYEVIGTPLDPDREWAFGQYIGAVLYEILEEQIAKGDTVYTGGADEKVE
jgi:hypothetical protein